MSKSTDDYSAPAYPSHESLYVKTRYGWRRFFPDVGEPRRGHPRTWVMSGWVMLNQSDETLRDPFRAVHGVGYGAHENGWLPASEVPNGQEPRQAPTPLIEIDA